MMLPRSQARPMQAFWVEELIIPDNAIKQGRSRITCGYLSSEPFCALACSLRQKAVEAPKFISVVPGSVVAHAAAFAVVAVIVVCVIISSLLMFSVVNDWSKQGDPGADNLTHSSQEVREPPKCQPRCRLNQATLDPEPLLTYRSPPAPRHQWNSYVFASDEPRTTYQTLLPKALHPKSGRSARL